MGQAEIKNVFPKIPPEEYFVTFRESDEHVVDQMATYLRNGRIDPIETLFVHVTHGEYPHATVYMQQTYDKGPLWTQLNWSKPGAIPAEYHQLNKKFLEFTGPVENQQNRARLLAQALEVEVKTVSEFPVENPLFMPSEGIVLLPNPSRGLTTILFGRDKPRLKQKHA
jgi:hypothetical protein